MPTEHKDLAADQLKALRAVALAASNYESIAGALLAEHMENSHRGYRDVEFELWRAMKHAREVGALEELDAD